MTIIKIFLALLFISAPIPSAQAQEIPASREQITLSYAPLVKKTAPAVVNIYTKRVVAARARNPFMDDPFFAPFFNNPSFGGRMRQQVQNTLGSGVIVEADGLVVTNAHVVKGADEITVALADGREFDARISLRDDPSDLALLRIDTKGEALPFAPLKPSESAQVGDLVLAIGNPFGVGQTVTSGIISALARSSLDINNFNFFIQTDAAINPGNSGGPLVAMDGGVIGINTAIYSRDGGSLGIGFAVPSEMVASVIAAEKSGQGVQNNKNGKAGIVRPWLGVTTQDMTSDIAKSLGLQRPQGVLVAELHPASPLKQAGIQIGDVIVKVNGHAIRDSSEAKFRMATVPIGQKAAFEISRKGAAMSFEVEAIAPPDEPPREKIVIKGQNPLNGAALVRVNPAVAVEMNLLPADDGKAVVYETAPGSYAARIVAPGDIILAINGQDIGGSPAAAQAALATPSRIGWAITLKRQGRVSQVVVR